MLEFFQNLEFSNYAWQLLTPLIFSLSDIISGYLQALINNDVKSVKMREGLIHKSLIILILLLSVVMSFAFNLKWISSTVALYICLMEATSILENLKKAGIDFQILKFINTKKGE